MTNLYHFVTNLATNPAGQMAFSQNPDTAMAAAGLSKTEQSILKSRDGAKVAAAFADELEEPGFIYYDPEPDPTPDPIPADDETADSDSSNDE